MTNPFLKHLFMFRQKYWFSEQFLMTQLTRGQKPTFFAYLYIFINFFIAIK